jgi:hypothetical protein
MAWDGAHAAFAWGGKPPSCLRVVCAHPIGFWGRGDGVGLSLLIIRYMECDDPTSNGVHGMAWDG